MLPRNPKFVQLVQTSLGSKANFIQLGCSSVSLRIHSWFLDQVLIWQSFLTNLAWAQRSAARHQWQPPKELLGDFGAKVFKMKPLGLVLAMVLEGLQNLIFRGFAL